MFDLLFPKHWSTLKKLIWLKAVALSSASEKTVSGSIVHIYDALARPAKNVTIDIEPVQSGSGDPSPDNVRPITGWTGATIHLNDTTVPISFGSAGTVYGGELDVTTGLLTVTLEGEVFTGEESWSSVSSGNNRFFRHTVDYRVLSSDRLCSHFKNVSITTSNTSVGYYSYSPASNENGYIQIRPDDVSTISTATAFKAWLAAQYANGTPVTAIWKRETPITYQLNGQQIKLLAGENTLWTDTGDTTLTYLADGEASDIEALEILLAGRYVNTGAADEVTDEEALNILLGR